MKKVTIGIDIGGTNTAIGVVDQQGNCLKKKSIPTNSSQGSAPYAKQVSETIKALMQDEELNLLGIGIGAPNGNYLRGTIEYAPNLDFEDIVPLTDLVGKYFDVPVLLTNDANAAALGEFVYGGARGMKDFIMITLGTGVGAGVVINGEMLYGHDGFAGELGHTVAIPNGRQCNCGKKGCLETYCSANGLRRTVFELMASSNQPSSLRNVSFKNITSRKVFDEAMDGDEIARQAFDITAEILGKQLADFAAFSSPEAFFIFGGLANAGDILFKPLETYFEDNLLEVYKGKMKIRKSELEEGNAAIVGASALVLNEVTS